MAKMVKFPKIFQFRDVIRRVRTQHDFKGLDENEKPIYEHTSSYPAYQFIGTVKLHGTNSSVVFDTNGEYHVQSRSRVITVESDNAGFAAFIHGVDREMQRGAEPARIPHPLSDFFGENIAVYGEFCGGNIQRGVALNQLPKMFVIFNYRRLNEDDENKYCQLLMSEDEVEELNAHNIYFIWQFPTFKLTVDFENPTMAQNEIVKLVDAVDNECPVGKYFGVSGVGEGIVWSRIDDPSSQYWFKTKGESHRVSQVKTVAAVDVEKVNSVQEFIEMTVTQNRLEQGLEYIREQGLTIERKNTGTYLKWVVGDILKEELDTLTGNGLCAKDVTGEISRTARPFWFKECDKL